MRKDGHRVGMYGRWHGRMRLRIAWLLTLAPAILLAGCARHPDDRSVLRVADQLGVLQSALAASGQDKPAGYTIAWSNFFSGPPIIAAQTGGSVDLGWMAETPLVFAQAAGSPVKVVAVSRGARAGSTNVALVVTANSPIRTIAGLKGKRVGYLAGTIAEYLVAKMLSDARLSLHDIDPVQMASFNPVTLKQGTVDAAVTTEPFLSQGLHDGTLRVLAFGGEPNTPGYGYLVASDAALTDPRRAALIGDFVARVAKATAWVRANPSKAAPYTAKNFNVTPQVAQMILERTAGRYAPIEPDIVAQHQQEADFFYKLKLIARPVDARTLFDARFNPLVGAAEPAR